MLLDRADREHEGLRDPRVRTALGHEPEHLELARRQPLERPVSPAREELRDDLGIERGASLGDPADRVDEVADVHDPVLQQVPDATAPVREELGRVRLLDVLRDDEDRGLRCTPPRLDRGADALVPERRREPDVDDRDVGLLRRDDSEQRVGVLDCRNHLEPAVSQEPREAVAE